MLFAAFHVQNRRKIVLLVCAETLCPRATHIHTQHTLIRLSRQKCIWKSSASSSFFDVLVKIAADCRASRFRMCWLSVSVPTSFQFPSTNATNFFPALSDSPSYSSNAVRFSSATAFGTALQWIGMGAMATYHALIPYIFSHVFSVFCVKCTLTSSHARTSPTATFKRVVIMLLGVLTYALSFRLYCFGPFHVKREQ